MNIFKKNMKIYLTAILKKAKEEKKNRVITDPSEHG